MSEIKFPGTFRTERLLLRPYTVADAQRLFALVEQDRNRLVESFPNLGRDLSRVGEVEGYILNRAEEWKNRKTFCYGIWLKCSEDLVGQVQVKNIAWHVPSAELSYFIASSWYRRGFATETIAAILAVAFSELGFARIFVRVISSNGESISLSTKLGFRHEGLHRNEFRCGLGNLHDVHYFSLTISDYRLDPGR